ncbi:hypothetical protein CDD82_2571 [Ophiocordyceps australis]|uniref:GLRG-09195 thioredoxin-like domain-containing protein n=1 Tax=Ophiocordyceps australis TaxID=1399860 RepID=A0A2C5ZHC4_9HYPO|nr:hypothetical protein CDD82_2571 [Ophiocordyceps australis]
MLAELGVRYARGSLAPNGLAPSDAVAAALPQHQLAMRYVDNDAARSVVHGEEAILLYLDARHARTASPPVLAQRFTLLQHAFDMARVLRLQTPLPNDDDTRVESP